ncbi:MAG TPA: UDP-N-acetylmuramoyl-L-alanyl-D-glutamate--2,6-diaminopimelate ligase [Saprospiraceae bacterium]|nr:UDP-N-acetylmuramoyl-L-alanyl-D-glutamate--2,6-diaminopimelate ligase [Saprospiraceae bacterium]HNT19850.1 UDP-N-acetylmuramoyl-L-alanyl-D-glutamate--2,6-diaminopimelate ligase [Saprospiraceae bacterium]
MNWTELKKHIQFFDIKGNAEFEVAGVESDSRRVKENFVFIAQKGLVTDGHRYIGAAVEQGARAILCESLPEVLSPGVEFLQVKDPALAAGILADGFYGQPSSRLKLVGVTGTNGKTTTATLLYRLMKALGFKAGLLSTVRNYIHDRAMETSHTTPDVIRINEMLALMVGAGCDYAFMEVSSHAMKQQRTAGLRFAGGVFTNLTHDHLDYHGTFKDYLDCKKLFFDQLPRDAFAVTNKDDRNGMVMVQNTRARVVTYALKQLAEVKGKIKANTLQGLVLEVNGMEVHSRLIGAFNGYNFLACFAAARELGFEPMEILAGMSGLPAVDGRFDTVYHAEKKVLGIVDYAHTPDALTNVLDTIKELKAPGSRVITVVGCGGDRDKTKRPVMARIAMEKSDAVIFTSDNPRTEDPQQILDDMIAGLEPQQMHRMIRQSDRREAIKSAARMADRPGDIILIAGKGHETYQEIQGKRFPFDDKNILKEVLI